MMMGNVGSRYLVSFIISIAVCFAQENAADKITPAAIDARIAEIRMGDIIIKAKPGADVSIQQIRHEFYFGTAISDKVVEKHEDAMPPDDRKMYLKIFEENFNYAVHEDALKWYDCEKEPGVVDYYLADRIWDICQERNIPMRGHCIFWAKQEFILPWVKEMNDEELCAAVTRRAFDVVKHFKGRINEFDLNNEMVHGDFYRRRLGYEIINEMSRLAHESNPDVVLYVNDYGILDIGYNTNAFILQIENLIASGVPVGGIGCQGHLSSAIPIITPSERVQKTLDRLSVFNLPIKITECLFAFDDEKLQAQELRRLFPIYFAHPKVEAIIMWGFWEGAHWQPHTAMWKKDWTPTPQALAYRDLVFNKWWTRASGKTDSNGIFKTHAFYGDYIITSNGLSKKVSLRKKDKVLHVNFE